MYHFLVEEENTIYEIDLECQRKKEQKEEEEKKKRKIEEMKKNTVRKE